MSEKTHRMDRDFVMHDDDFEFLRTAAYSHTGIVLADHKKDMVYSRLARRLRALGLRTFKEYCSILEEGDAHELNEFINSITTNLTSFFRENHHFEHLKTIALPEVLKRNVASRRIRIWSSACSTGEEPYSVAICLRELGIPKQWDVKILATDLDSNVVATGRAGVYGHERIEGLDPERIKRSFMKQRGDPHRVMVKPDVSEVVSFKRLNLLEAWPMKMQYDVVFCRNVVIYFNKDTQRILFDRIADQMVMGGYLYIGHSESLTGVSKRFELVGRTIYRKVS